MSSLHEQLARIADQDKTGTLTRNPKRNYTICGFFGDRMKNSAKEIITVLSVTSIAVLSAWILGADSKDILVGAVSGLVGYLSKEAST